MKSFFHKDLDIEDVLHPAADCFFCSYFYSCGFSYSHVRLFPIFVWPYFVNSVSFIIHMTEKETAERDEPVGGLCLGACVFSLLICFSSCLFVSLVVSFV